MTRIFVVYTYTSVDNLSSLAYKVEQQQKAKGKGVVSKPIVRFCIGGG